ncbi:MAG: MGMT family protein [Nanoarchaeota archaeon]
MNSQTSFQKKVFSIVARIPYGKVMTYAQISARLNSSPRAVGQALKRNKNTKRIPCHRVVCSDGRIGGYFGVRYKEKIRLLEKEGWKIKEMRIINFNHE